MVNANELRIGNWVTFDGKPISVRSGDIHYFDDNNSGMGDPIPLTPEILEKCSVGTRPYPYWKESFGMDKIYLLNNESFMDQNSLFHDKKDGTYWYIVAGIYENIVIKGTPLDGHFKVVELKSLHQLQNLYFALTGEELVVKL